MVASVRAIKLYQTAWVELGPTESLVFSQPPPKATPEALMVVGGQ